MVFGLFSSFGIWELLIILAIVLLIFGPSKLPKLAEGIGEAIKGFRKAKEDTIDELEAKDPNPDE